MEELGSLLEVEIGLLPFGRLILEKCFTSCLGTRGLSRGLTCILGTSGPETSAGRLAISFCLAVRLGHPAAFWAAVSDRGKDKADKQRTNHPYWIKRHEFTIGRIGRSGFLIDVNTKSQHACVLSIPSID